MKRKKEYYRHSRDIECRGCGCSFPKCECLEAYERRLQRVIDKEVREELEEINKCQDL